MSNNRKRIGAIEIFWDGTNITAIYHDLMESNASLGHGMRERISTRDTIAEKGQCFPIPLSKGRKVAINFESLPVELKDIEAIKEWLELFSDSLTETKQKGTGEPFDSAASPTK